MCFRWIWSFGFHCVLHCYYVLVFTDLSKVNCISEGKFLGNFTRGIRMGNCPPRWAIRLEIAGKLYPILRAIRPKPKFLIEIPDFGGNSLRNYPEPEGRPEGNFQKFPRASGNFCEFPTKSGIFNKCWFLYLFYTL